MWHLQRLRTQRALELSIPTNERTVDRMVVCQCGWSSPSSADDFAMHLCECGDPFLVACRVGTASSGRLLDGAEVMAALPRIRSNSTTQNEEAV